MSTQPLLPGSSCLTLESLRVEGGVIVFTARTVTGWAACPLCGHRTERVHSHYPRTLLDLPWQGNAVRITLTVRRFFCDNRDCQRRVFAERLPAVAERYARKTCRLADALRELAYLAGGEAAARIARAFGLLISPDALLDGLKKAPPLSLAAPRVLGIDDFAFKKGHHYGTILIDLEKRCPVDLLADREAETVETWLKEHPGVQIISRDRGNAYKEGATKGAPEAVQVADRWHLLKNLGEALERQVAQQHRPLREVAQQMAVAAQTESEKPEILSPCVPTRVEQQSAVRREQRLARYTQVWELRRKGLTIGDIAAQTGVSPRTVQRFLRAQQFPERSRRRPQPMQSEPFVAYLRQRLEEGCHNAAQLFREVRAQGYLGGYTSIYQLIRQMQPFPSPGSSPTPSNPGPKTRSPTRAQGLVPSSRSVAWWLQGYGCTAKPEVEAYQRAFAECLCQQAPALNEAAELARQFHQIVKERQATALEEWLQAAKQSASTELKIFAQGLCQDRAAVENAVRLCWSNGPVEGQVNRLKMIKRQMYGRAGFELLRARVLPAAA